MTEVSSSPFSSCVVQVSVLLQLLRSEFSEEVEFVSREVEFVSREEDASWEQEEERHRQYGVSRNFQLVQDRIPRQHCLFCRNMSHKRVRFGTLCT